jgi:hypothetical protein
MYSGPIKPMFLEGEVQMGTPTDIVVVDDAKETAFAVQLVR